MGKDEVYEEEWLMVTPVVIPPYLSFNKQASEWAAITSPWSHLAAHELASKTADTNGNLLVFCRFSYRVVVITSHWYWYWFCNTFSVVYLVICLFFCIWNLFVFLLETQLQQYYRVIWKREDTGYQHGRLIYEILF